MGGLGTKEAESQRFSPRPAAEHLSEGLGEGLLSQQKRPRVCDHTTPGQRASVLRGETEEAPRNAPLPAGAPAPRLSVSLD